MLYSGVLDGFVKIVKSEGVLGLYKGFGVAYLRLGPHISVSLVIWDWLRVLYYKKS
jgi:solute carrier family 25, member 34/35